MNTTNLFAAAELVYSEFDALRASRREHNIPESMDRALEALAAALYSPEMDKQQSSQSDQTARFSEPEMEKIVNLANSGFFDSMSLAMAAEGLLFKSSGGESDDEVVAARNVLDQLAAKALAMASEMDMVVVRRRFEAA